jgi:hypothetical protein
MCRNQESTLAYHVFDLTIVSDFDLPLSERTVSKSNVDVSISKGVASTENRKGHRVRFDGVATVQMVDESTLIVEPDAEMDSSLHPFLLHNCLGWVLHRRGKAIFHAGAANVNDICVAFLGQSGVGKSSTVAAMYDQGYPVVSGDVLAVDQSENIPSVIPSFPRLRIPSDTLSVMKKSHQPANAAEMTSSNWLDVTDGFAHETLPIRTIYFLEELGGVNSPEIRCLESTDPRPVENLLRHSLHYSVLHESDSVERHFQQCTQLAQDVSFRRLRRPNELKALEEVVETIVNDVQRL